MPVEVKPLFRVDVLRPHLRAFQLPPHVEKLRDKIASWGEMVSSGRAASFKEQELLPDFLTDIFCGVLGYTNAVDAKDRFTFKREKYNEVDGAFADAVLGEFKPGVQDKFIVAIEGKGPKDPLDRPFAGRKMSAVDQGYRYAINLRCDWIIITSIKETRLYHKGSDQQTFERFETETLARDEAQLKRFVFLMGADRMVNPDTPCHLYHLLTASENVERELTKEFYVQYAGMREQAFNHLCQSNPDIQAIEILASTQKLLDRILFCAFCEDRELLPAETIAKAFKHSDPYNPRPIWENFQGLFRSIDKGNPALRIPAYNGGLFATDQKLDGLAVPDEVCAYFRDLAAYDYRSLQQAIDDADDDGGTQIIDVDILGHIFEQSITDLERLRNELDGLTERQDFVEHTSRRKKEGAFYTPAFMTRYIVGEALGSVLKERFETLRDQTAKAAKGTAKQALTQPDVYDLATLKAPQREALVRFWEDWQTELANIKVLDPSCGSGAFLIEAFDQLYTVYQKSNDRLQELRGERTLFDLDRQILQNNIYGVDLNEEAIQIGRLSLWIKTAQRGKALTSLDHTIRGGNSIIADPAVHPRAFNWQAAFPEVFEQGGFDVVVGNPPYVRQEWISPFKPYLQANYKSYHGMADLYVYFYELGLKLLRPGGRLSFVVTNKWIKAAYGEPLRQFFAENAWMESVVDFGHAKQIFQDADVFPSVIVARKPTREPAPLNTRVCAIPREQLRINDLRTQIDSEGFDVERSSLGKQAWSLEPKEVNEILEKLRTVSAPLSDYINNKPKAGIKTGFNEAFLIDTPTRNALVNADPACEAIIKPYLRGQDVNRWLPDWAGLWMIALKSSGDFSWPWSNAGDNAESMFQNTFPSLYARMKPLEAQLTRRQDQGRYWWELRSCAYWDEFEKPKLFYQEIQFHPSYTLDAVGQLANNKVFFIPVNDLYLLSVLNSPLMWWHNWRYLPHMKDEALSPVGYLIESLPIVTPDEKTRNKTETFAKQLIDIASRQRATCHAILDWLQVEHEIASPSMKLQAPYELDSDAFAAEVKKLRGRRNPLSLAALRGLREEHERTIVPAQKLAREAQALEKTISDLVNEAYGLTPAEVTLMWETAPPRMPISSPRAS